MTPNPAAKLAAGLGVLTDAAAPDDFGGGDVLGLEPLEEFVGYYQSHRGTSRDTQPLASVPVTPYPHVARLTNCNKMSPKGVACRATSCYPRNQCE